MKICLVTTFPPSTGGLSEYGFHIAQELQRNPSLNLTVLADELPPGHSELDGFSVERCWSYDRTAGIFRLLQTINRLRPDLVWFNLLFSTFGRSPLAAFSGLMTPLFARLRGSYTHVTLHHLMDTVNLKDAGVRHEWLYRAAGAVATRGLLLSNSVSVLIPSYRKILNDKYGRDNVHLRSHGILSQRPELPEFSRRGNPHRILAFGKWGTYKRLELMIEAFALVANDLPDAKLIIGGGDHPSAAGYIESMKQQCAGDPKIEFCGYVPEDSLSELFQASSVAVMPYSSSTGCSGVAHLACAYGVPIVCADLADFRQMALGEELAIEFFPPGSADGLADCLIQLLQDPAKQQAMASQNFSAALRMTMPNLVQKYLRHFEVHQRSQALRAVSRLRKLPRWMPSKSLMLRFLTRNSAGWTNDLATRVSPVNGRGASPPYDNGNGRGKRNGARTTAERDGIAPVDAGLERTRPRIPTGKCDPS
jgi:glycosyltransferase involved in cell wall biosynthesis